MAKRKPLLPYKYGNAGYAAVIEAQPYRPATLLHPVEIQARSGLAKARAKHQDDSATHGPMPLTLADRFYALPGELRTQIFALLLVQPVKWKLKHEMACTLFTDPNLDIRLPWCKYARTPGHPSSTSLRQWRIRTTGNRGWQGADRHPWRSRYAAEITNPFQDSLDWDQEWRERVTGIAFPKLNDDMPCLCARRQTLDILLVCRRWYEEAARVLWGSNTFAFDSCKLFVDFVRSCTAAHMVTSVSILHPRRIHAESQYYFEPQWPDWYYHKQRKAVIAAIRDLPSLTHVELDSVFLKDPRDVQALLRLGMKGLSSVRFIYHEPGGVSVAKNHRRPPKNEGEQPRNTHRIYHSLHTAVLLRGGLPEEVARAMKGDHRAWTKHTDLIATAEARRRSDARRKRQRPGVSLLQTAVEKHIAFEETIKTMTIAPERVVNCDDEAFWAQLWWKTDGRLHWSQSYLPLGSD